MYGSGKDGNAQLSDIRSMPSDRPAAGKTGGVRPLRALLACALTGALVVAGGASVRAEEPTAPVATVEPMPDSSPESVWVDISRLAAGTPVVITWGDGWQNTVTSRCTPAQAARDAKPCRLRVRHAFDRDGRYPVTVTWGAATVTTATVDALKSVPSGDRSWRRHMLQDVNRLRAAAGVAPVRMCYRLTRSAQGYAATMGNRDHYGHVGLDGSNVWQRVVASGYRAAIAAENIGAGQRSVADVMADWRASSSHYAALVDPTYTHIGFGYLAAFTARYPTYWVQHLGRGGECK